ncbi:MAG TPA: D-2-hydroxyacid dehydrogenase [Anaerolineales bacterium]|nr:D-2-hydroxyacid dehydrogenase [Anaerolineales bacterium]
MPEVVVLIALAFPEALIERLRSVSPELRIHVHPAQKAEELPAELLPDVEVLYTHRALPDPSAVPSLRWVQFHFAGIDHTDQHPLLTSGVQITTLSGAAMAQMAEFAVMAILGLGHRLPGIMAERLKKRWTDDRFDRFRPLELRGSTVGLVGYGSVAREIARLCRAFGARVLAAKRDLMQLGDLGYVPEGLGDPNAELPERIYPPQALASMASECDFVVVTVPLTPETRGLVGRKVFAAMKPTSFLVDISRGGVVDHGALVEALAEKRIAGAALDVYPVEPLPENSPLWDMPNLILSPHLAGASAEYLQRAAELFSENLRRYLTGQPLLNLYHPKRGY